MSLTVFLILSLASFRLTRLIVFDKITAFLRAPFFEEVEETNSEGETEVFYTPRKTMIRGFIGQLLSCYWCTGIWVSAFVLMIYFLFPFLVPVLIILAIAGLASILESIVQVLVNK